MKAANVTKTKSKKLKGADKTPSGKVGGTNTNVKAVTNPKGRPTKSTAPKKAKPSSC
jgi:hypothetical protein